MIIIIMIIIIIIIIRLPPAWTKSSVANFDPPLLRNS